MATHDRATFIHVFSVNHYISSNHTAHKQSLYLFIFGNTLVVLVHICPGSCFFVAQCRTQPFLAVFCLVCLQSLACSLGFCCVFSLAGPLFALLLVVVGKHSVSLVYICIFAFILILHCHLIAHSL